MSHRPIASLCLAAALAACGAAPDDAASRDAQPLRLAAGPRAFAYDFGHRGDLVHGVAGDRHLVFVTEPLHGAIVALDRVTGALRGTLAPPPGGWLLPFMLRLPEEGRLVVLDAGGFPSPTALATPRVYDVAYRYDPRTRALSSSIARAVVFTGVPVGFAEDLEVTASGDYVMSDSVLGALWVIRRDGSIAPGIVPAGFAPADAIPALAPCAFPGTTIAGVPFTTGGNFAPGVGFLASNRTHLYFSTTCNGGVYRVPLAALTDPSLTAAARTSRIAVVSPRPAGVVESLKALTFNRYDPADTRLYASDPIRQRLIRIHVGTGAREELLADGDLFDFPVGAAFLPPLLPGVTPMVVTSDQEYRLAALNPAIPADLFRAPFIVAKVFVAPPGASHPRVGP